MAKNTSGLKPPWKPGETGNPGGRPKKRPITDEYAALANIEVPPQILKRLKLPPGLTFAQANAVRRFVDALMKGGYQASKEIREAMEGKAPMRMEIVGTERKEVILRVTFESRNPQLNS